jgi:HK97 gp10 family phage protein
MVIKEDAGGIDAFIQSTVTATEEAKNTFLKATAKETKAAVIKHVPKSTPVTLRRGKERTASHVHMKDDVVASVVEDKKYGGKMARIRGGRRTGTLWHLVNDGTYRSQASHFIDKAMNDVDDMIDGLLDNAMKDV